MDNKDTLVLIDGNSLINRAFYALPLMLTKDGRHTNAVYGFCSMLVKIITEINPKSMVVAFDLPAPTFRKTLYPLYKAQRKGMPDELAAQMPILKTLLSDMGISIAEKAGFEADDIIGTLSKRFKDSTVIVTGDRDSLQLIDNSTSVWLTKKGITEIVKYDEKKLFADYSLTPAQIIDLKSLMGDASDNIPGIAGVGEKTALSLLERFSTLDGIYNNTAEIKGKLQETVIKGKESAYLSYKLAAIDINVDLPCDISDCAVNFPFSEKIREKFAELEFKSLLRRAELFEGGEKKPETNAEQMTLF